MCVGVSLQQRQYEEERMRQAIQASMEEENMRKAMEMSRRVRDRT